MIQSLQGVFSMAIDSRVDAVEKQYPESDKSLFLALVPTAVELALPHAAPLLKFVELIKDHFSTKERQERVNQFLAILRDQEKLLEVLGTNFDKLKVKIEDLAEAVQIATWRDAEAFNNASAPAMRKLSEMPLGAKTKFRILPHSSATLSNSANVI
jgi:hypothetical protein